jgi:hypothetical protein
VRSQRASRPIRTAPERSRIRTVAACVSQDDAKLDRDRALEVLGLPTDASSDEVNQRHRELLRDYTGRVEGGGQETNRARDVLLQPASQERVPMTAAKQLARAVVRD